MIVVKALVIGPALLVLAAASDLVDVGDAASPFHRPDAANAALVANAPRASHPATPGPHEPTRFDRAGDGLFYVRAIVNGVPVRFVLDTGATLVVLTPEDARRIGATGRAGAQSDSMETAGGRSAIERITLDRVRLAGHAVTGVDAAVAHTGLKTSLLGQNLLSQLGPITLSADSVELR